jgi:hypothetical protein
MSERTNQRFDISVGVIVRWDGKNEPCLSHTLSPRGMSIGTSKRWPIGTALEVEIVHEGMRIRTQARVAGETKSTVGLEFVDPSPDFENRLKTLLARYVPQSGQAQNARVSIDATVEWESPEDDQPKRWWRSKRNKTKLIDLSLDGAALIGKKPPDVGSIIVLYLLAPKGSADEGTSGEVQANAKIVRHTDRGFAVQFVNPSQAFRRVVSDIRKAARGTE